MGAIELPKLRKASNGKQCDEARIIGMSWQNKKLLAWFQIMSGKRLVHNLRRR